MLSSGRGAAIAAAVAIIGIVSVLGGALGAGFGFGFLGGAVPVIQIPSELVGTIFGYQLVNTVVMFVLAGIVLVAITWLATRNISEVPGRWQALMEIFYEFFTNLAESTSGRKGRMFLPVATAIFLVVLFSNWLGVLPVVGTFGRVETTEEWFFHKFEDYIIEHEDELKHGHALEEQFEAVVHHDHKLFGGFIANSAKWASNPGQAAGEPEGKVPPITDAQGLDEVLEDLTYVLQKMLTGTYGEQNFVVFNNAPGFRILPFGRGEDYKVPLSHILGYDLDLSDLSAADVREIGMRVQASTAPAAAPRDGDYEVWDERQDEYAQMVGGTGSADPKRVGLLIPYLRGSSTDLNMTLAIAIFAMISVQVWGFRALGFSGYSGKFFFNPIKAPIDFVVGILEFIGEFIKVVSFTFRLFGNMFAGEVLLIAMGFLFPLIGMIPFIGLELFVGFIQAIIFSVLTLMFGAFAIMPHHHPEHDDHAEHSDHHDDGHTATDPGDAPDPYALAPTQSTSDTPMHAADTQPASSQNSSLGTPRLRHALSGAAAGAVAEPGTSDIGAPKSAPQPLQAAGA